METVSCRSFDDVVNFAIRKEENSMALFEEFARRAQNPGIRDFFRELAEEERKHRDMLKDLKPFGLEDFTVEQAQDFQIADHLVDLNFADDITYQEALTIAMKKKQRAVEFYTSWRNQCIHEKTARVFEYLAEAERKEKAALEAKYDDEILGWN